VWRKAVPVFIAAHHSTPGKAHFTITGGEYRIPRRLKKYLKADGLGLPRPPRRGWLARCLHRVTGMREAA
jgi:hypothetical protein